MILDKEIIERLEYTLRTLKAVNNKENKARLHIRLEYQEEKKLQAEQKRAAYQNDICKDLKKIQEISDVLVSQYNNYVP